MFVGIQVDLIVLSWFLLSRSHAARRTVNKSSRVTAILWAPPQGPVQLLRGCGGTTPPCWLPICTATTMITTASVAVTSCIGGPAVTAIGKGRSGTAKTPPPRTPMTTPGRAGAPCLLCRVSGERLHSSAPRPDRALRARPSCASHFVRADRTDCRHYDGRWPGAEPLGERADTTPSGDCTRASRR
jgi:hypothetical protein